MHEAGATFIPKIWMRTIMGMCSIYLAKDPTKRIIVIINTSVPQSKMASQGPKTESIGKTICNNTIFNTPILTISVQVDVSKSDRQSK